MIASIFFRYFSSISFLYSGLIRVAAWVKAEFLRPDLWHSITVEVRMGTMWLGNLLMFAATLSNILAAVR